MPSRPPKKRSQKPAAPSPLALRRRLNAVKKKMAQMQEKHDRLMSLIEKQREKISRLESGISWESNSIEQLRDEIRNHESSIRWHAGELPKEVAKEKAERKKNRRPFTKADEAEFRRYSQHTKNMQNLRKAIVSKRQKIDKANRKIAGLKARLHIARTAEGYRRLLEAKEKLAEESAGVKATHDELAAALGLPTRRYR